MIGQNSGLAGAVIGAATPWLVRRALTPAGLVLIGGAVAAKAAYDHLQSRRDDVVTPERNPAVY